MNDLPHLGRACVRFDVACLSTDPGKPVRLTLTGFGAFIVHQFLWGRSPWAIGVSYPLGQDGNPRHDMAADVNG